MKAYLVREALKLTKDVDFRRMVAEMLEYATFEEYYGYGPKLTPKDTFARWLWTEAWSMARQEWSMGGCQCHRLPEYDLDGSYFTGRCVWCEERDRQRMDAYADLPARF